MQTPTELPKTGHFWLDIAAYIAITLVCVLKGLDFLRTLGIIAPKESKKEAQSTGMFKATNGGGPSGLRSAELWEYRIADIVEKKTAPLKEAISEVAEIQDRMRGEVSRILIIIENGSRTHRRD